jgi:hypothetical protein
MAVPIKDKYLKTRSGQRRLRKRQNGQNQKISDRNEIVGGIAPRMKTREIIVL